MFRSVKKFFIVVLLIAGLGCPVFATGMPVVDVAAIAQAVAGFVQDVQNWSQQLQQWKSEYDRLKAASEKIASGDFTAIVTGIGNLANQMSGWADYAELGRESDWLSNVGDSSYSLLKMLSSGKLLVANYSYLTEKMQKNMETIQAKARNTAELTGDQFFAASDFSMKTILNTLQNGGSALVSGLDAYNGLAENINALFEVSPKELAKMYDNTIEKALKAAGIDKVEDIEVAIANNTKQIIKETEKLGGMDRTTQTRQYDEQAAMIQNLQNTNVNLANLKDWVTKMQEQKEKILDKQKDYEQSVNNERFEELSSAKKALEISAAEALSTAQNIQTLKVSQNLNNFNPDEGLL